MPIKILHVIPTLSSLAGGPSEVAINLVRHLNALGAQAEILTTDDNGKRRLPVELRELTMYKEVPVRFFSRINPRLKEFIISPSAIKWLSSNILQYDILDIHYLFSFVPSLAQTIARKRKIPYTVRTMGQLSPWALQQSKFKKKIFFNLQELNNLRAANALHSSSKLEENDIRTFGLQNEIINIPLGVEMPNIIHKASEVIRQKYNLQEGAFILLFLSRLHPKKRPELMIETVAELRKKYQVHLILAGSGETIYENELRKLTCNLNVEDVVTFVGFVEGREKDELLQGSDVFVLPSFSENFGIAVAESLAAGTPVVITQEVQISEYVEEYRAGLIVSGNQTSSFVQTLSMCIENREMMERLRQNGLELVRNRFQWNVIAEDLLNNYQQVLNRMV